MRTFSWQYFAKTGDIDAYLLFKASAEEDELPITQQMMQMEVGEEQLPTVEDLQSN